VINDRAIDESQYASAVVADPKHVPVISGRPFKKAIELNVKPHAQEQTDVTESGSHYQNPDLLIA